MGVTENKSGEEKQRLIPKLTADSQNGDTTTTKKTETQAERIERINKVEVTFSDFFVKCLDHEMLKLTAGSLFCFFFVVGIVTCFYLFFIYLFKESMWQVYFPTEHHHQSHGEL